MNSNPIKVGIIGVHPEKGWAATAHIPALRALPEFRITAVSHNKPETARAAALKFGADHGFGTTDELVNDPNVDLVVVTVKVPRHLELVTKALVAGKAVFSEWPLGMNLSDAERMLALAKSKNAFTAIGLQTRSVPAISYMRDLITDGYLAMSSQFRSSDLASSGARRSARATSIPWTWPTEPPCSTCHSPTRLTLPSMRSACG